MKLQNLVIGTLLIATVIVALVFGLSQLANDNNLTNPLKENSVINNSIEDLENNLLDINETAEGVKSSFENETPNFAAGFILFGSVIKGSKTLGSVVINTFDLMFTTISETLGISPIILAVMGAILLILLFFAAWRLFKVGD